jgi:predicted component of type VI protein secretion system
VLDKHHLATFEPRLACSMSAPQQQQQQGQAQSKPDKNQSEEVIAASLFSQQVTLMWKLEGMVMVAAASHRVRTASALHEYLYAVGV